MPKLKKLLFSYCFIFLLFLSFNCVRVSASNVPAQVTELTQTKGSSSSINLEWKAILDKVSYQVEISEDGINWPDSLKQTKTITSTSYSTLNPCSSYYVRVRAYTSAWDSELKEQVYTYGPYSDVLECVTAPKDNPSELSVDDATDNTVTLSWDKVDGADSYVVSYKPYLSNTNIDFKTVIADTNSITIKNLENNSRYMIDIYAQKVNKEKSFLATSSTLVANRYYIYLRPSKVKNINVVGLWSNIEQAQFHCSGAKGHEDYQLEVWSAYDKKNKRLSTALDRGYTDGTVFVRMPSLGKFKVFKVRARAISYLSSGKFNTSDWSNWLYISRQPTIKTVSTKNKGIKVSWQKVDGAAKYNVYMSTNEKAGFKKISTTTKTSLNVKKFNKKNIKKNKTYYFKVIPVVKEGKKFKAIDSSKYTSYECKYVK